MKTTVLIPAYNEEERIVETILALRARPEINRIVVVDDGSIDKTADRARDAGADHVIRLPKNHGKGAALTAAAKKIGASAEIILLLDADLGASATECVKLIAPIERGEADMTVGMLPPDPELASAGQQGGGSGYVVRLARNGLEKRTGIKFQQPLAGQRAMKKAVLDAIGGKFAKGFGVEVALTLETVKRGFSIIEIDTAFRHRVTGSNWLGLLHRGRQFVDVALALMEQSNHA
jgi:glycosyltransferase involved in cell wall biosynthesis